MTQPDPIQPDPIQPDASLPASALQEPNSTRVTEYLLYTLSIPERAVRSTTAVVGGAIKESAVMLVPQSFRNAKSYEMLIEQTLDFLCRDVGGVACDESPDKPAVDNYVARKAVGGFVEMATLPLLHVSPMMVLAIVSDVAYGSQAYLNELSAELKEQGIIDEDTTIDHASDLLEAISHTSSTTAKVVDTPPLSVEGLSETIKQVTDAASGINPTKLIPEAEIDQLWQEMHELAQREHMNVMDVSVTMAMFALQKVETFGHGALSTIRVAGNMFDEHILDHYEEAVASIRQRGIYPTLADASKPYVQAMWHNFSSERETITEDLLSGKLFGRTLQSVRNWFGSASSKTVSE